MGAERLIPLLVLAALGAGCQGSSEPAENGSAVRQTAVVERVNDGDTLTLRTGQKIRLVQIDAPELTSECYGRAAAAALVALAPEGTRVTIVGDPTLDDVDQHGRLLRYVVVGETNVNVELVRRGAASQYFFRNDRGRHAGELLDAVEEARATRRGYWGSCPGADLNTGIGAVTGPA